MPLTTTCGSATGCAGMRNLKSSVRSAQSKPASIRRTLVAMTLASFLPKICAICARARSRLKL